MARSVGFASPALVQVAAAGTPVQIEASSVLKAHSVIIQALSTNEGSVCVGDKNVKAAPGTHASPTQRGIQLKKEQSISIDTADLSRIWIDAEHNGDGVAIGVTLA